MDGRMFEGLVKSVLAFDPSINNLGYALLEMDRGKMNLVRSGCWHPKTTKGARYRFDQLSDFVFEMVCDRQFEAVAIEIPSGGQRQNYKSLMTYARAIGAVESAANAACSWMPIYRIPVNAWKRNAKKGHTARVVKAALGVTTKTTDECDAIGLALWFLEVGWLYADKLEGGVLATQSPALAGKE